MTIAPASSAITGAGIALEQRCACPGGKRRLPLRVQPTGMIKIAVALRHAGADMPPADTPLLSYRCGDCQLTLVLTLQDLYLAEPES